MILRKLSEFQKSEYEEFVLKHGSFVQSWDWGEFQESLGRKVYRYAVEVDQKIVLSCQIVQFRSAGKVYVSASYGPVMAKQNAGVFTFFLEEVKKTFPEAIFFRIEPQFDFSELRDQKKGFKKSIDLNPHQTWVLDLDKNIDVLLSEMHPKTRYNIRLAQKKGVTVQVSTDLGSAGSLFLSTAQRGGFNSFSAEYYKQLLNFFSDNSRSIKAVLYTGYHESDLLAGNIVIEWGKTWTYLFGASADHKRNLMVPYLLHFQAFEDAQTAGAQLYDFWGVEQNPNHPWFGFSKFKMGFGGRLLVYSGTWDFVLRPAWYNAYTVIRVLNRAIKR